MKKYLYLAAFCLLLGPTVSAQNDADKGIEFPHRVVTDCWEWVKVPIMQKY